MMAAKDAEVERVRLEKDQYMALQQEYLKIATDSGFELEKLRLQMTEKENAKRATEERAKLLQRKLEKEETDRRNEREKLVRALEASDSTEENKRLEATLDSLNKLHEAEQQLKREKDAIAKKQEDIEKLLKESQVGGEGPRNFSLFAPLPSAINHRSLNEAITIQHEVEETTPQHYSPADVCSGRSG